MANWAKNQIVKQLAKFAKNLDPNSLSLKFFKGECELTNLELNEVMLSDLLEFPPWLQLTKVTCNKISAKVPWTSLKSDPIQLHLDCVEVKIVASEIARKKATNIPAFGNKTNMKPNKYGFAEKVVDGMLISINTVLVSFTSLGFKASVNVSRISIRSTTPDWKETNNLRHTRIKDEMLGEVLNFKEIRWHTLRVDVDAAYRPESKDIPSAPLRLITNNSSVRLVIKKRISDCQMIASKLAIILDDILWVLTRSQILKLSSFIHYLIKLRSKFLPISHQTASVLNKQNVHATSSPRQQLTSQNQLFAAYDLAETSIHLRTQGVDLHLCDDSIIDCTNQASQTKSSKKKGLDESGAALQISLVNIALDHCPYHVVGKKRTVVKGDDEVSYQRKKWSTQLMNNFQETEGKFWKNKSGRNTRPVMYESFFVVNCQNFQVNQVTTASSLEPKPFLASEKEALFLPADMSALHIDHTTFYYTDTEDFAVPAPNVFVQVNPIQLTFDPLTCVWLNRFAQSVITGLDWTKEFMSRESGFVEHVNVRVEALMPKVIIPLKTDTSVAHNDERPTGMQMQISQVVVSNCRVGGKVSQTDLLNDLQSFLGSRHYSDSSCYPNQDKDFIPFSNAAWLNDFSINYHQIQNLTGRDAGLYDRLKISNNLPHDIWCVWCEQLWIEFTGIEKASKRPVIFVDAFPLRLWICQDVPYYPATERSVSRESDSSSVEVGAEVDEELVTATAATAKNKFSPRHSASDSCVAQMPNRRISTHPTQSLGNTQLTNFALSGEVIRQSHSESDIAFSTRLRVDYTEIEPPPPYNSHLVTNDLSDSVPSLPPAYDAISEEDPGEINKPVIADIIDYNVECDKVPSRAMLINVTKTVQIQLDHFQMLYLVRMGEVFQLVAEKVALDNELCGNERKSSLSQWKNIGQLEKTQESLLLNISIPYVIVDLVLPPCFGIEPIQQLSLRERVDYDRENETEHLKRETLTLENMTFLPVRKAVSLSSTPEKSYSGLSSPNRSKKECEVECLQQDSSLTSHETARSFVDSLVQYSGQDLPDDCFDETLKEVCDIGVQAGEPLMRMNLKPLPEHQLVSVLRIRSECITVGIQADGKDSLVKAAAQTLMVNECGNMKYGKILDPRGAVVRDKEREKQQINMDTITGDGVFKMRLMLGPTAERFAKGGEELGFADIRIKGLASALLMSTVDNLTEFAEDEFILPTMPFIVNINDSDISLYDDKPRRYKSAIKYPPAKILIDNLFVKRDCDGVVTICRNEVASGSDLVRQSNIGSDVVDFSSRVHSASVNSTLIAETINQQVDALIGENGRLLEDLKVVNAKVNGLHAERDSLLKVIDKLQLELMHSNRENDDLHNRVRTLSLNRSRGNYV